MAQTRGIVTTAEGVETEEQVTLLGASGCQEAQGYQLSRPKPAIEICKFLQEQQENNYAFRGRRFHQLPEFPQKAGGTGA
jgi:EAL domain-containing protein (putative c-di-GMP-specific phosphodiesterase class I)